MKKYHKLHRHKDPNHKRSLKHRHKHKKEKQPTNESILAPIEEVPKEKIELDTNACGDYEVPRLEDGRKKKSKHPSREKREKTDNVEKLDQEQINIFARNYLQKLRESTNEKLVRHQSLEKSGDSLIEKTKNLARKEKSFNDAVQKVSVDLEINNQEGKRDRKRRHKSEKDEQIKERREKHKSREKSSKRKDKESREDQLQNKEKKEKNIIKHRAKSNGKSPVSSKIIHNRIQEVIYCQMDQVPYKLKNDKSADKIKDLYRRIKQEKRHGKKRENSIKELSLLRDEDNTNSDLKKSMNYQSHHSPNDRKINIKKEKRTDRSKSRSNQVPKEDIQRDTKSKRQKKKCHNDPDYLPEDALKRDSAGKHKKGSLSNIDLGPYHKYFAFENKDAIDHNKHRNKDDEQTRKEKRRPRERKHGLNQEEVVNNVEYDHMPCKKHHTRHEGKTEKIEENKLRADEEKIHQIVEGDLKTYLTKIQHMIDRKLDVILQINKSIHNKTSDTKFGGKDNRKRSKSRDKYVKSEKEEPSNSKIEGRIRAADKSKHNDDTSKEAIIQEVLRRIKKEEISQPKHNKDVAMKHDSKDLKVSKTCNKCQELKRARSRPKDGSSIQMSSNPRHAEVLKDLEQQGSPGSRKPSARKHEHAKMQYMDGKNQEEPTDISKTNNPQEIFSRRSSDKKRGFSEKQPLPSDYIKNRGAPSDVVVPAADINRVECEVKSKRRHRSPYTGVISTREEVSRHSLKKHHTSASNCHAYSGQTLDTVQHVANDELRRERCHLHRRRSSSPEKCYRVDQNQNHHRNYEMASADHKTCRENYIIPPPEHRESKHRSEDYPDRRRSRHRIVQYADPKLENIILPPETFRTVQKRLNHPREKVNQDVRSPEQQHVKQEFLVQGIEPPILECSRHKGLVRPRNLECKTVSIVGIPPQMIVKDMPVTNMTQTSSKVQKSVNLDGDLVGKRKKSKRFNLYYKYSVVNNSKEDSISSEAKSVISDSYRVISNASDEGSAAVCYSKDVKITRERQMTSELFQVLNIPPKKWNRISTPRDSHLNNIVEEPSNISNSVKNDEFFIPIMGINDCYFKPFTSSHSEYCFKINKKPANSNISIVSRDTCEERYRYYEDARCRYCKRSRSDVHVLSHGHGIQMFRSKSEVFLAGASGKKVIRSIFLEDSHPYVKSKRAKERNFVPRNVLKEKNTTGTADNKLCQTSDVKVDFDIIPVYEEGNELVIKDKRRQFENIYKTIDDLEETIHSSRKTPPDTLDLSVCSTSMSLDKSSDKKPQFQEIYKTIDNLQNKMRNNANKPFPKTVDKAIGSSIKTERNRRTSRSEPRKQTHEVAVGNSNDLIMRKVRTPGYKSEIRGNRLKSTGVSPIRVVENLQNSFKSPRRKTMTPISPSIRPYLTRPSTQQPARTIRDDITTKTVPRVAETRREPISLRSKILVVKNPQLKSSELTERSEIQKNVSQVDVSQPIQKIKMLRSEGKSVTVKRRENVVPNRVGRTDEPYEKEKSDLIEPNVSENDKPITNKIPIASKASERKCTTKEEPDLFRKADSVTSVDNVHNSCVHHNYPKDSVVQKTPRSVVASIPARTVQTPVTVNTALIKCRPISKKKSTAGEGSTSSSLGDDSAQNIRRSRSLVEVRARKGNVNRSKSEIISGGKTLVICNSRGPETNAGSFISGNMERYSNVPRLRCQSSKSAIHSLDQFIGNKFTSTLFVTKDYKGREVSAYQRRKLYDQSIRQKMKKKFRFSKLDVGPQIFEVRFLSMVRQENAQRKEKEARATNSLDRNLIALNLEKAKTEGNFYQRKNKDDGERRKRKEEDIHIVTKRLNHVDNKIPGLCFDTKDYSQSPNGGQPHADVQKHQNNLNHNKGKNTDINTNVEDQSVMQLYFNDQELNQKKLLSFCNKLLEVNSGLEFPEEFKGAQCECSKYSDDCQCCKNFVNLMDMLCTSVASYCDSKTKLVNFELDDDFLSLQSTDKSDQNIKSDTNVSERVLKEEFDNRRIQLSNLEIQEDACKNVQEIFSRSGNHSSGESTDQRDTLFKNIVDCANNSTTNNTNTVPSLSQPLSCPVLATNASSFDFLYEETSSSDNQEASREMVFANLTRPFDQNFNFSLSQYNVETPFLCRSSCFSPMGSTESGYASIKSRSFKEHSLTNFFKKPNIAALLKPHALQRGKSDPSKLCQPKSQCDFKKSVLYEKMAKSCQLYARKVRESSEMKAAGKGDVYQEFSLELLLGKDNSLMLESAAISQHSSIHAHDAADVCNEDVESYTDDIVKIEFETEDIGVCDTDSFTENGCKLVLNNEYLRTNSITYLGADFFNLEQEFLGKVSQQQLEVDSKKNHDNSILVDVDSSLTFDFSLDLNNPFLPNKDILTRKFFGSLLKIYEKEMELCNELFKNDEFLKNVLLPAIKERKNAEKRNKQGRFSRFFRKKIQDNQSNNEKNKYMGILQVEACAKLQGLASNAKKCFTMLAEAVKVNENIDDEIKICGLLKLLERIETGDFYMIKNDGDSNIEDDIKSQVKEAFTNIYEICEKEAKKVKRTVGSQEINLIQRFISKYRIGLLSKTDIVACYIGRGIIQTEAHLKAAVTYLMRSQASQVNIKEFEEYCKFTK